MGSVCVLHASLTEYVLFFGTAIDTTGHSGSQCPDVLLHCNSSRVRTILVLGYWVLLGNIHSYWVVLLLGDIFCCSDTQYNANQTAVSTIHMPVNNYLVPLVTCDRCNHLSGHRANMLLFIKHTHCHHHRVLGFFVIDIGIGYWYH